MNDTLNDSAASTRTATTSSPPRRIGVLKSILRSRRWLILLPIAFGILVVVLMVRSKKEIPQSVVPEQSVRVAIYEAVPETIETQVVGYGTAKPSRSWTAIAEVSGRIESINPALESGNSVKAGETLLTIDPEDYRLRVLQRTADLDSAKANLAELKANEIADRMLLKTEKNLLQVAQKDLDRSKKLRAANAVSVSEVDTSQSSLFQQMQAVQRIENSISLYPSRVQSAEAKVAMAESAVAEAKRNVERTVITSPIDGVLSGVELEAGQFVSPNQLLFEVQDNRRVEIEAQISLSQLNQITPIPVDGEFATNALDWLGDIRAEVTSESGTQTFRWQGTPIRLTESIDAQTRTIGVVIGVSNPTQPTAVTDQSPEASMEEVGLTSGESQSRSNKNRTELKIGTYCEVKLVGSPESNLIAIPRTAFDGNQVYIVDRENRLQSRIVSRGSSVGDRVIVNSGIEANDRVIVRPPIPAIEGMLVRQQ